MSEFPYRVRKLASSFFWASALVGCWRIVCWLIAAPRGLEAFVALPGLFIAWALIYAEATK